MSFLDQLKSQASAVQSEQSAQQTHNEANVKLAEAASKTVWLYVTELAKQLNVIQPAAPPLSLDGKTIWPAMKLVDFRVDARKKKLRDKEVFDYVVMAWRIVPRDGAPVAASVSANFPPDLQRIESRLAAGLVQHERVNVRHPEKHTLQAIRFDHSTEARGSITITPDHLDAKMAFRIASAKGFAIVDASYPASRVQTGLLDELAKLIVGQANSFG